MDNEELYLNIDDILEEWEISAYEQFEEREREELEERAWREYNEERREE